ncbi:MAG TPA: OmpA family protein [Prolixibacteraceae bacterium]|jgi:outer membrane protein OmpA-like peptidoglycan-associated protein
MSRLILSIFLFIFFVNCFAQNNKVINKKVESLYNEAKTNAQAGDKAKAIALLNQVLRNDPQFYMAFFGLADIYHETKEHQLEKEALINGLQISSDQFPVGYKFLAELLYAEASYAEALKNMEAFNRLKKPLTTEENRLLESCRFAAKAVESPVAFHPENAGKSINTNEDEYWPSLNGEANTLVFTRLITKDAEGRKISFPQEDFYVSRKDSSGWQKALPLGPPVNTGENEGAQCISADGRLLFYTGCNRPDGLGSCDIYMSVRQKGKWSEPVNLGKPVNSGSWESQPSVSADGHWLYFTSNRGGGKGKMDIWRAESIGVTPEGFPVYGKVINIESINTPGNELSPFIHADGKTLYFASDFWPGMGGKDLFFVSIDSTKTSIPQNLGYPVNTSNNEEGLVVEVSGERAWYTANNSGFGGRDIFTFLLPEALKPQPVSWVKGKVVNRKTGQLIFSDIVLNDLVTNRPSQHLYPFENEGEFLFCLPAGHNYGLNISKEGFLFHSENFNLLKANNLQQPLTLTIALDPIENGKTTILKNIFFETDSFRLEPESRGQLKEIVDFMNMNRGLVIEIGGHTDNQGSENYNLVLSAKRADAVVKSLIDMGIPPARLKSRGYGFSIPVADNSTEEGRALNRRTEFKILESKLKN